MNYQFLESLLKPLLYKMLNGFEKTFGGGEGGVVSVCG